MRSANILLAFGLLFGWATSGCIAGGGGGSYHIPPLVLTDGDNALRLELTPSSGSYSKVVCVYRIDNEVAISVPMTDLGVFGDRRVYECNFALGRTAVGKKFSYSFSYVHGSATNTRTEAPIIVEASVASSTDPPPPSPK